MHEGPTPNATAMNSEKADACDFFVKMRRTGRDRWGLGGEFTR